MNAVEKEEIEKKAHAIMNRVWGGRRLLFDVNLSPDRPNPPIKIVVGRANWSHLMAYLTEVVDPLYGPFFVAFGPMSNGRGTAPKMFGLEVEVDDMIGDGDIRFRSEISL